MLDTAMSSADDALDTAVSLINVRQPRSLVTHEVTAMNIRSNVHAAPPFPNNATAALGSTNPALTSASGIRFG
jgi:hypothetical protein